MKKFIATFMMMALMAIVLPLAADAQIRNKRYYKNRTHTTRTYQRPNFYQRNRNVINIAAGTGAGALIGGILGGKKGAFIGGALGAGGSAIYTYKVRPNKRRY